MMIEFIECGCSDERKKKSDKEIEELCKVFGHAVLHMFHFVMVFSVPATLTCQHNIEHLSANSKKKEKLNANNKSSSKKLLTLEMFV